MTDTATAVPSTSSTNNEPKGLLSRAVGVLFSPRATYANVAAHPRSFGILALSIFIVAISVSTFLSTEVGREALLDRQIGSAESFGLKITDEQYARLEQFLPYVGYISACVQAVVLPISAAVIAAIALVVFNVVLGGDAMFKQIFAIVAHSGVVIALQNIFTMPLDYVRETLSSPTTLAVFFPFLDDDTFAGRLLASIDLFVIWWTLSLAIGFAVLYKRRTGPIATSLVLVYVTIAVVIAAVRSALSGA